MLCYIKSIDNHGESLGSVIIGYFYIVSVFSGILKQFMQLILFYNKFFFEEMTPFTLRMGPLIFIFPLFLCMEF